MKTFDYLEKFLIENPETWREKIVSDFNLQFRESEEYVLFSYSLIDNPNFNSQIARQARGPVFRKSDWKRVCNPFDKFFNYGEEQADHIDFSGNVAAIDKLDGSIIKLWYDQEWKISSNGSLNIHNVDVRNPTNEIQTFYDILIDIEPEFISFENKDYYLSKDHTYIFEIMHQQNPIVVEDGNKLYLIGIRKNDLTEDFLVHHKSNLTLIDKLISEFPNLRLPELIEGDFKSYSDLVKVAEKLNDKDGPATKEGFVVLNYDDDNQVLRRVKIKSSHYLLFHSFVDSAYTRNQFIEKIHIGDEAEVETYLHNMPTHIQTSWYELKDAHLQMIEDIKSEIGSYLKSWEFLTRKDFFINLNNSNLDSAAKSMVSIMVLKNINLNQALRQMHVKKFKKEILKRLN